MGSNPTATATPLLTSSTSGGFNVPRWARPGSFSMRRGARSSGMAGGAALAGGLTGFRRHELELGHPNGLGRPRRFDVTQVEAELA